MINRIRGLYARYADRHASLILPAMDLPDFDGDAPGRIERITITGKLIRIEGWSFADQVVLSWAGGSVVQRPHINRPDVAAVFGASGDETGIVLDAPAGLGPYRLTLRHGHAEATVSVAEASAFRLALSRLRLLFRFARDLVAIAPATIRWQRTRDPAERAWVKRRLGLDTIHAQAALNARTFLADGAEDTDVPGDPVTIILPVYNAHDLLIDSLHRVKAHTDLPWHLVLVEDCSSDPRIRPMLRDWAGREGDAVTLLENTENQGFIKSVNRALDVAAAKATHVILLNSDALVPQGWASRLLRPILEDPTVASVTPMSNDAEIYSVPTICKRTVLEPGEADRLDEIARGLDARALQCLAPTGVGFCMAMNRAFLQRIPRLDTEFGRGYGEEVDWCQKARALGGAHRVAANLFVEHRGGESFGSVEKQALVLKNNAIISARYITYDRDVQRFISEDPLVSPRLALGLALVDARAEGPVPVYLAHSLGGGAEIYLQERIEKDLALGQPSVVLRVGGAHRFQLELRCPSGETTGTTNDADLVARLLCILTRKRIVYSCGVGDPVAHQLPDVLLSLQGPGDLLEVLMHDYFPISPSYCLLDQTGTFRGPVTSENRDPAHCFGGKLDLQSWQKAWGRLLCAADEIVVFSESSRNLVLSTYPALGDTIALRPHGLHVSVDPVEPPDTGKTVIGVLGNIGYQKGAALLVDLARHVKTDPEVELALIGNIDPNFGLPRHVAVHGDYHIQDLPNLASRYGVTCWLIPSIWPETFSYTTHECLATGLPVFAFDIGAQGDAVKAAPNGRAIAFSEDGAVAENVLQRIKQAR